MPYGLPEKTVETVRGVLLKYPQIREAVLYGSRAMGNFRNGSDIDLTLKGAGATSSVAGSVANDLEDSLVPYTFDISAFSEISNPDLIDHINRVGVVFYEQKKDHV